MSIISTIYKRAGELEGMPIIEETGLCTNDQDTLNALRRYENEDIQFSRIPRRVGMTVKTLDGSGPAQSFTIVDKLIGRFHNCIQDGRTRTEPYAPVQPIGNFAGKAILRYSRRWVQLQE